MNLLHHWGGRRGTCFLFEGFDSTLFLLNKSAFVINCTVTRTCRISPIFLIVLETAWHFTNIDILWYLWTAVHKVEGACSFLQSCCTRRSLAVKKTEFFAPVFWWKLYGASAVGGSPAKLDSEEQECLMGIRAPGFQMCNAAYFPPAPLLQ